jgi:hypothetical protein
MGIVVGGQHAWKVERKGDIVRAFHWVNGEPAMVLFPVRKRLGAGAFVVCMSAAHKYARRDGYPTEYSIAQAHKAATLMAMDTNKGTVHNIVTTIIDGISDLVRMPPEPQLPQKKLASIGEITLKSQGRVIGSVEVDEPAPSMMIDTPGMSLQ